MIQNSKNFFKNRHCQSAISIVSRWFADGSEKLIGFSKPCCPQQLGHIVTLSYTAFGGKITATRCAGGRWLHRLETDYGAENHPVIRL
jgi:hypothetical protein